MKMKIQLWLSHVNNHKNIMGEIQNFPNIEKNVKKELQEMNTDK